MTKMQNPNHYLLEGDGEIPLFLRLFVVIPSFFLTHYLLVILLDRLGIDWSFLEIKGATVNTGPIEIPSLLIVVFLDYVFISLWFTHKILYYDRETASIIGEGRFLLIPWKKIIPVATIISVGYRVGHVKASTVYNVSVSLNDDKGAWLSQYGTKEDADELVRKISEVTGKPIVPMK